MHQASSIKHQASSIKAILTICTLGLLVGCSTLTNKEIGQLNFEYASPAQQQDTNKVIAIVTPSFKGAQATAPQQPTNPLILMALAQQNGQMTEVDFNKLFQDSYRGQLVSALQNTFNEIISKQGFRTGDYATFDDMTYPDKKSSYLASVPKLTLVIDKKPTKNECKSGYCTEEGVIQVTGELNISIIEPLTSQSFINKRINLSDFGIAENYILQRDDHRASHPIASIFNSFSKPKAYQDNTDKALTNALNIFYSKASEKIAQYISREELLSLEDEVMKLKGVKRF